jgi:hypothetical protein
MRGQLKERKSQSHKEGNIVGRADHAPRPPTSVFRDGVVANEMATAISDGFERSGPD